MARMNKKSIVGFLTAISLFLTGCSTSENHEYVSENSSQTNCEEETFTSETSIIMPETTTAPKDKLTEDYLSYFNSLNFSYSNEELYPDEKDLNNILKTVNKLNKCSYKFDGNINELVKKLKENTNTFVEEHPEYKNPFVLHNLEYSKVLTKVMKSIKNDCHNNIDEDFHQISNMAFVIGGTEQFAGENSDDFYIAYYEDGLNIIIINQNYLEDLVEWYEHPYELFLYYIISHETNHTRQNVCPCNYDFEYNNISFNHEGYSFILEAAAESDLYNTREFSEILSAFSYSYERKAEGELFLLGILNDSLDDYYNAIFDMNYNSLFEFFDLQTNEEKVDFLKMLYSIDATFFRNDLVYHLFKTDDEIPEWVTLSDAERAVGFTYKENIFKNCMINLVEYTSNHSDFSLQENLILFNIIKSYLIDKTYSYDYTGDRIYAQKVIANIDEMERAYVKYLSEKYQTSEEKIREYESSEITYIIEAAKYILEDGSDNYGSYSNAAQNVMKKFPVIRGILMTNLNLPYNVYEKRISVLNLTPQK